MMEKLDIQNIITDSDLDGLMCALLLKTIYPKAFVTFTDAQSIEQNTVELNMQKSAICDLPPQKGVSLYFDHHESNFKKIVDTNGKWKVSDSATSLIYSYFQKNTKLKKFKDLIKITDLIDSGKFSLKQYQNPEDFLLLGISLQRENKAMLYLLLELLLHYQIDDVFKHSFIKSYLFLEKTKLLNNSTILKNNTKLINDIAIADLTKIKSEVSGASYAVSSLFSKSSAVITIRKQSNTLKVRFYKNSFNKKAKQYNLLKALDYIPHITGGGHSYACGFNTKSALNEALIKSFVEAIEKTKL